MLRDDFLRGYLFGITVMGLLTVWAYDPGRISGALRDVAGWIDKHAVDPTERELRQAGLRDTV
jgi:hypothetical protein